MKKGIILVILLFLFTMLFADWDAKRYGGNQLTIMLTNYGIFGQNVLTGSSGAYWPAGYPDETYIFGAGIWFGGLIDTSGDTLCDTLVSAGYRPASGVTEFSPGDDINHDSTDIVYLSNSDNNGLGWPIKDEEGNDYVFSDIDAFCLFNDKDSSQHFTEENLPLDIEVREYGYEWNTVFLQDVKFIKYIVKNARTDGKTIKNAYISVATDNDIGNESGSAANDILGFIDTITTNYGNTADTLIQLNTVYQFQLDSEPGWEHTPAIISYILLQTPKATDSIDLYHDGNFIIEPGQEIGLTSLYSFSLQTDPVNKEERYQLLAGYDHLSFDPNDPEASYEPFPTWGQGTSGYPGQTESESSDKRFILSTGPFTLSPGDSVEYVFAICMNRSVDDIVPNASYLIYLWHNQGELGIKEKTKRNNNVMYISKPIINDELVLNIVSNGALFDINIYDIQGRKVEHLFNGNITGQREIKKQLHLNNGVYFIKDILNNSKSLKFIIM